MPVITQHLAVEPSLLAGNDSKWRPMRRIDTTGGDTDLVTRAMQDQNPPFERWIYAEGDSWFDKFTPLPANGSNLLDAIHTPFHAAVVDVAHIGDEAREMVRDRQARQTKAMFKLFDFHAILLSAGGNDLKNLFADLFKRKASAQTGAPALSPDEVRQLATPSSFTEHFEEVMRNIESFIRLRNRAERDITCNAPIFVHGYDYFQPRPAGALLFAGTRIGVGPWLYPSMKAAGLDDDEMRAAADAVVDEMNRQLKEKIALLPNVRVIDQRGLLTPAPAGSSTAVGDWMDEIHPSKQGFTTLARNRWDVPLSLALGWQPGPGDTVPAKTPTTVSTALGQTPPRT